MLQTSNEIQKTFQHGSEWFVITNEGNYIYSDPKFCGNGSWKKVNVTYAQWLMEREGFDYVEYGSI